MTTIDRLAGLEMANVMYRLHADAKRNALRAMRDGDLAAQDSWLLVADGIASVRDELQNRFAPDGWVNAVPVEGP